ncbi:integrase [Devosia subaequoris]|uniref:Integrase n=1 Tax=Devosia subaequoris TaxID=395930 RepID=A0A7W6NDL7_9HYPH|nr:hypothetical protein [Devosia subaequoris]MBB4053969.1 integrase [Devosia subaequoris]MCP1211579.1 hypothetical protein [Devosia subaequoris]
MAEHVFLGFEVTRTLSTEIEYADRVAMLMRRASSALGRPATLLDTIQHLSGQHDEFAPASIRKYFAALTAAFEEALAADTALAHPEADYRGALEKRPRPRPPSKERRTSARKRKDVLRAEVKTVCRYLWDRGESDDKLLVRLIIHGVFLGLRPSEHSEARRNGSVLIVYSRKITNGRGLGPLRELDLGNVSEDELYSIDKLIAAFAKAGCEELELVIDRLGARLRRACRRVGVKPFALYTTRHQAIANMKAAGETTTEIAAMAGHKSQQTASKYYAKRRSGWKNAPSASATRDMVAKFDVAVPVPTPPSPRPY